MTNHKSSSDAGALVPALRALEAALADWDDKQSPRLTLVREDRVWGAARAVAALLHAAEAPSQTCGVVLTRWDGSRRCTKPAGHGSEHQNGPDQWRDDDLPSVSPPSQETAAERIRVLEQAIGNCFMMAKRQIAAHLNDTSTPAQDLERWQHVQRFCETTGSKSSILRGQLPTELTEGSEPETAAETDLGFLDLVNPNGQRIRIPIEEHHIEPETAAETLPEQCINCAYTFGALDVRHYFGPPIKQVGPLCEKCDRLIKTHVGPPPSPETAAETLIARLRADASQVVFEVHPETSPGAVSRLLTEAADALEQAEATCARLEADLAAVREALERILAEPYGCPMCDSGKLRDPAKAHWNMCGFKKARAALAAAPSAPQKETP